MTMIPWRPLLRALVLCALMPAMNAWADAAGATAGAETIRAGNKAFRDGDYEAAISKFLSAHPQGQDGAVARFNLGVAYYRSGDYANAEQWLLLSTHDSGFRSRARYNLGLVYWARGDTRSARSAFNLVEKFSDSRKLKTLAGRALRDLYRGADSPAQRRTVVAGVDTGYTIRTSMKYGYDDNVFRTPDAPYLDLAQTGAPLVTPNVETGAFAEANLTAQNTFWSGRHVLLRTAYDFDGHYNTDRKLQNGDEYSHRLSVSARRPLGPQLDRTLFIRMYLGHHDEINFDPDSGVERTAATEDIADRFKYWNAVAMAEYERPVGPVTLALRGMTELRNYGKVETVSEYDNKFFLASLSASAPLFRRTQLKLAYDRYARIYEERKALNANGALVATNPKLEYQYNALSLTALFDSGKTEFEIGYTLTDRADKFVGYNDYRRDSIRVAGSWRPNRRLRLEFTGLSSSYDYSNAFAFDVPQGGKKTLDIIEAEFSARFSITRNLEIVAEARYWNEDSSDPRIAYERLQAPIGLTWIQRF